MSSLSIQNVSWPGTTPSVSASAGTAVQQPQTATPGAAAHKDTVKLSQSAQVVTLYRSGQSVSSISSALGISKSTVNDYLGLIEETAVSGSGGGGGGGGAAAGASASASSSGSSSGSSSTASTAVSSDSGSAATPVADAGSGSTEADAAVAAGAQAATASEPVAAPAEAPAPSTISVMA